MREVWASPAIVVTKKHGGCVVGDYCVVNEWVQKVPGVMLDLEAEMQRLRGVERTFDVDSCCRATGSARCRTRRETSLQLPR